MDVGRWNWQLAGRSGSVAVMNWRWKNFQQRETERPSESTNYYPFTQSRAGASRYNSAASRNTPQTHKHKQKLPVTKQQQLEIHPKTRNRRPHVTLSKSEQPPYLCLNGSK